MSASLCEHIILDMTTNSMYLCCFIGALCAEQSPGENYLQTLHTYDSHGLVIQFVRDWLERSDELLFRSVAPTQIFDLVAQP